MKFLRFFGVKELGLPKTIRNSNPTGTSHPDKVFIVLQKETNSIEYMKVFHFMASLFKRIFFSCGLLLTIIVLFETGAPLPACHVRCYVPRFR